MKILIYAFIVMIVAFEISGHSSYVLLTMLCFFTIKEYELKAITNRLNMLEQKNKEIP
jgi:hypothetical protein